MHRWFNQSKSAVGLNVVDRIHRRDAHPNDRRFRNPLIGGVTQQEACFFRACTSSGVSTTKRILATLSDRVCSVGQAAVGPGGLLNKFVWRN